MTLHWPQLTVLLFYAFVLGIEIRDHGKAKTGKDNVYASAGAVAALMFVLYRGGFFTPCGAP